MIKKHLYDEKGYISTGNRILTQSIFKWITHVCIHVHL